MFESLNYIHPHNLPLPPPPTPATFCLLPSAFAKGDSLPTVSGDAHTRPPYTSLSQQDGGEYLVRLAYFYFSRSFWLCQDRLEHNLRWNLASGREKERDFPRVVFSSASKESENVRFSSLFFHGCPSRM